MPRPRHQPAYQHKERASPKQREVRVGSCAREETCSSVTVTLQRMPHSFAQHREPCMWGGRSLMEQQQQQAKTPARPRATARRVPGLEGVTGTLRVNVQGKPPPFFFKVHDGLIEQVEDAG